MRAVGGRRLAAILLVVTAALFVIGVSVEDDTHSEASEGVADQPAGQAEGSHVEANESEAGHEEGEESEAEGSTVEGEGSGHDEEAEGETVLGVDAESPAIVTMAVLASLALAAGLWFTHRRLAAVATVVLAGLFALFDIAEVFHQLDESRTGLAVLAVVIAVGHAAAAVLAGRSAWPRPS